MEKETLTTLMKRAEIFTCSYDKAWKKWMTDEEKSGFSYKQIMDYLINK